MLADNRSVWSKQSKLYMWRESYNPRRPRQALGMKAPVGRYRASVWSFPEVLSAIEYGPGGEVKVAYFCQQKVAEIDRRRQGC